jgi:hypothetical protein
MRILRCFAAIIPPVPRSDGLKKKRNVLSDSMTQGAVSMSSDEYDDDTSAADQDEHEHEVEEALEEALELDTQSQIFLEMRRQNLDLLRIATSVAGYSGGHAPLKPGDVKTALRSIWDIFSDFYTWIDPEEAEGDEDDIDEDED